MLDLLSSSVKRVLKKHGYFSLIFPLLPLFPNTGLWHARVYTRLLHSISPKKVIATEELLKLLFGELAAKEYAIYFKNNAPLILANPALKRLKETHDTTGFLKTISLMFFDRRQRHHPDSDRQRAQVVRELSHIISLYRNEHHRRFRSRLVQIMSSLAHIDQSPLVHEAIITSSHALLQETNLINRRRRTAKLNGVSETLLAKLKSQLSGKHSIYSAKYRHIGVSQSEPFNHLLTNHDVEALTNTLHFLASKPAPDTKLDALESLRSIKGFQLVTR